MPKPSELKALETVYKGYRFRSRLEARWALFFDRLNIAWRYEPEGFDLDGEGYLPDFYLPHTSGGIYFETKGTSPNERERRVASKLSEVSRRLVIISSGDPLDAIEGNAISLYCTDMTENPEGNQWQGTWENASPVYLKWKDQDFHFHVSGLSKPYPCLMIEEGYLCLSFVHRSLGYPDSTGIIKEIASLMGGTVIKSERISVGSERFGDFALPLAEPCDEQTINVLLDQHNKNNFAKIAEEIRSYRFDPGGRF